jgi:diguanylate cyclase (GGDEF)-like protein/PAS domain S-box-containing protein
MNKTLKLWFAPPVFPAEPEKTRRAGLLYLINLVTLAYTDLLLVFSLLGSQVAPNTFALVLMVSFTFVLFAYALRRGKVDLVGIGLLGFTFIFSLVAVLSLGTIRSPTTSNFLFVVLLAGLLFGGRGILLASISSSATIGGLIFLENAGYLPQANYSVTILQWFSYSGLIVVIGSVLYYSIESTRQALERAEQEIRVRKGVEESLRIFLRAVEQSPASTVITNLAGEIQYVNARFTQVTGYTLEEALGKNSRFLKTEFTNPENYTSLWDALPDGKEWRGEFVNRKKDGSIYYEEAVISPILDQDGVITHYLAVKEDITERKRMEDELRQSESRFRALFEQSHDGVFILRLDESIQDANQRAAEMLGYTVEEMRQFTGRDVFANNNLSQNSFERVLSGENVPLIERFFRKKNGEIFPVEITVELVRGKNGNPMHVQCVARDISERKQAEEALRTSEARFRYLFDQAHDAVFILDLNGNHITANRRAAEMLGYSVEEIQKISFRQTSAEADKSLDVMNRLLAGEQVPLYERLFRKKNGETLPVEINLELVRDHKGNPLHIQSVVRDISQRKQAELALKTANEQLQLRIDEVEKLQAELVEQALHDPLTGLYNRRYLKNALNVELSRANREKKPISIVAMDIDFFKKVNDTYGHNVGDLFLVMVGNLIKQHIRGTDFVCRYGGEEFLLIMPGADALAAQKRAEEIRQKTEEARIEHDGKQLSVTLSLGFATYPEHGSADEIITLADKALYHSKHTGRNRVTAWREHDMVIE